MLNVSVEKDGALVPDLDQSSFSVLDNGVEQEIDFFERGDVPASIGLVLDNSRSIESNRTVVVNAALQFLRQLNPADEAFVIHFSDDVLAVEQPEGGLYSSNRGALETAVRQLRPIGITRLYDAIALGLEQLEKGQWERKALVVLSDGGDNGSAIGRDDVEDLITGSDAPIFSIGVFDDRWSDVDPGVLEGFAERSGGRAFVPREVRELPQIWRRVAQLVHSQYTIGYAPSDISPGYHEVEVLVPNRDVEVRAREGYSVRLPADPATEP